jgi:3-phosphoshikimate 1-carboxyvinyltransferase
LHTATQERIIRPARNVYGSLRLPGDKSISHRYGMLAAFAEGTSRFTNFSTGADCASTLACMEALGAKVRSSEDGSVDGDRRGRSRDPSRSGARLRQLRLDHAHDLRPAGSAAGPLHADRRRFALSPAHGAHSQAARSAMGARLTLTDGHAPLTIEGNPLQAIDYTTPVPSAQVKTCVLLAGLQTAGTTTVREAVRTRDHSELALRAFGATLTRTVDSVSIAGPQRFTPSTPPCPATFLPPHSFCAPRLCFPAPRWCSIRSASTPPAPRCWMC